VGLLLPYICIIASDVVCQVLLYMLRLLSLNGEQNFKPMKKPVGAIKSSSMRGTFSKHDVVHNEQNRKWNEPCSEEVVSIRQWITFIISVRPQ
jgi:hypothetical protein